MKTTGIWEKNEEAMRVSIPGWYWFVWGFFVMPVGLLLVLYTKIGLIGGGFITPLRLHNKKKIHKDGSRSIRFYDDDTIVL